MLILTGTEKFKTEEDRDKFLTSIPDMSDPTVIAKIPSGTTIEDFGKSVEQNVHIAMEAPIDTDAGKTFEELSGEKPAAAPAPDPNTPPQPPQTPQAPVETPQPPPADNPTPPAVPAFDQSMMEKRIEKMQSEYETQLEANKTAYQKLKEETEEKLKSLKPEEVKPDIDPNLESQLKTKLSRVKEISSKIQSFDDLLDDEAVALQKESILLNAEINDLNYAKTNSIHESAKKKIEAAREVASNAVKTIEEQREAERVAAEKQKAEEASKSELSEYHSMMDTFKNNNPSFKDTRPYADMERDYVEFSAKLASMWDGEKLPEETTPEEREKAYAKYAQKTPSLIEKMQASGVVPPKDLESYAVLSEVGALYGGSVFDPATGTWSDRVNNRGVKIGYSSVNEAFNAYLIKSGKKENDIIAARRDAIAEFTRATDTRSNPVELDNAFQQGSVDDMSIEHANKIVNDESFDTTRMVMIARAGASAAEADKVILSQYNKAMKALGIPELNEES